MLHRTTITVTLTWIAAYYSAGTTHATPAPAPPPQPLYETRTDHDPDGTGRFYLGREIAAVMSHHGIPWLERQERQNEERPDLLLPLLQLQPGHVVADVGSGSGYYARRLAQAVQPNGRVYAVDVQPEMLTALRQRMRQAGLTNYVPILASETDPRLPENTLDLALLVDVYHELSYPHEIIAALCHALKSGGRLALVEYRGEDPAVPIKPLHKMTEAQVRKEMAHHPLTWITNHPTLPWQHVLILQKQ
jgi:ubiquinone/menaquinone biosynthesis C-methylase UbiE